MNEYRKIVNFYYKNRKFQLLLDNDNKYFFLEINNNSFSYVDINDFVELCKIFCRYPNKMMAVRENKFSLIPKVLINGVATVLTLTTLVGCTSKPNTPVNVVETDDDISQSLSMDIEQDNVIEEDDYIVDNVSFVVEDKDVELKVDTYLDNDFCDYIYVYGMDVLDNYLDYSDVSLEQLMNRVDENTKIADKFRPYVKEFINSVFNKYPECDKRLFYENLKTLQVVECDEMQLLEKTGSNDAYACYVHGENAIYTLYGYNYDKGTWEYQVLMHELAHSFRNGIIEYGEKDIKVSAMGNALSLVTVDEALNSVFTVSLFDYEERDIAYQLQSNYCTVMLDCLNNYDLTDYIDHSLSYYAKKLDEQNMHNNYATTIFALIDTQYKDYHSDFISIEQEEYFPIYDYIANMYYNKYISIEMSYSDARTVADDLIERITYDVPEEYNIDTNRFYDYLDMYCMNMGLEIENISRGR